MKHLLFLLIVVTNLNGQDFVLPLWENEIPNWRETGEVDVVNMDAEMAHYSMVTEPDISVYLPPGKPDSGSQAVLVIPGGAYQVVVHKWEGSDIAKMLNANGIAAVVLKYRLPHAKSNIVRHKSPLMDASRAMKMIRANAGAWNIDGNNIGVMGFSAGGHLASTLGTHFDSDSCRPDFMVLMYPVITMDSSYTHMGSRRNLLGPNPDNELIEYYSNEKQVTENTPPTFIIHSSDDKAVPVRNSIAFYTALQENGVKSELHVYQYGGHGFALANGKGYLESWKQRCIDWLRALD